LFLILVGRAPAPVWDFGANHHLVKEANVLRKPLRVSHSSIPSGAVNAARGKCRPGCGEVFGPRMALGVMAFGSALFTGLTRRGFLAYCLPREADAVRDQISADQADR